MNGPAALKKIIGQAEREIEALAVAHGHAATGIFSHGAADIHPRHLAFWLTFDTDAGRDLFLNDRPLLDAIRAKLVALGYPETAVPHVGVTAESQETVDRDFEGNWRYAMK